MPHFNHHYLRYKAILTVVAYERVCELGSIAAGDVQTPALWPPNYHAESK